MQIFTQPDTYMVQHYDLEPTLTCLGNGGLILYPTDTIWGIGCDATNEEAVERVFELKNRGRSKPFVLLVSSISMLKEYVERVHPRVETLLLYHKRPLTIIYEKGVKLAKNATAADGSVAIRIPNDIFCRQLIERFEKPILATSANISDTPFPEHFGQISSTVIMGVDHVVKHRQLDKEMGEPSAIVRLDSAGELVFLRD